MISSSIRMADSGSLDLKLDYSATNACGIGDVVVSDAFSAGGHTWIVNCYPRGDKKEDNNGEYLSLFLKLVGESKNVKAIFDAFMMEKDGKPSSSVAKRCVQVYPPEGFTDWGWPQFVKRSDLESSYVVNGKVRIMCVVIVLRDGDMYRVPEPPPDIGVHLGRLLDSADGTDVSFIVDGETFPAHRAVLAARSPVFRAELLGSMAESKMSCITVQDIEPVIFRALLRFIYTDELPGDIMVLEDSSSTATTRDELFKKLLAAADRYDLSRLKLMCAQKLWETLSVETVMTMIVYAKMHSCPELKKRCLDFLLTGKNLESVLDLFMN
ncbi:hypothetical protein E2562_001783 [Oryza meyeriana var. granulata]|uniref:BTB domain-containing protein n=1 Tax=Oryza meyeriana var. granulata TaxID=110450 RepID=A0A6G1CBW7_9ORYZ|nr:hypothetical protein E2562_001783 [Oryza meyeriana var. granulata]